MNSKKFKKMGKNSNMPFDSSKLLRTHGIYPTPQRLTIANILLARHQHLTAEQIYESIRSEHNKVSQATVYNTLGLFVEKGLLHEVFVDSSKTFYDTNTKPHQHFYNIDTGQLIDIKSHLEPSFIKNALPADTQIDSITTIVRIKNHSS